MPPLTSGLFTGAALGKMAEVGQRLGSGAYLLSALRTGPSRPVSTGGGPGCLLVACASPQSPVRERCARGEDQPVSERRAARRRARKLFSTGKSEGQPRSAIFLCAATLEPRFIGLDETSLRNLAAALQPSSPCAGLLQQSVLCGRLTLWSKAGVPIHPDPFKSPQQPRTFCTVVFVFAPKRPGCGLRRLQLHPDALKTSAGSRNYSWSSSEDVPHLHRSRTAYYDILSVSPSATQSQIKTAYYKQSFIYHPDKNPGSKEATQRFSEISEAYSVLGNISLRRKYDRGILSQSDIQTAGRPSSKVSRSTGSSQQQQQQQQQRARQFSQAGGKPMFDFDAFYQAHYGEQLQRERELKARKQQLEEMQKKRQSRWREQKMMELTLTLVMAMGGLIFMSLCKP